MAIEFPYYSEQHYQYALVIAQALGYTEKPTRDECKAFLKHWYENIENEFLDITLDSVVKYIQPSMDNSNNIWEAFTKLKRTHIGDPTYTPYRERNYAWHYWKHATGYTEPS